MLIGQESGSDLARLLEMPCASRARFSMNGAHVQ